MDDRDGWEERNGDGVGYEGPGEEDAGPGEEDAGTVERRGRLGGGGW